MKTRGPANPFEILEMTVSEHAEGVRRTVITYSDGVIIETRHSAPVEVGCLLANAHLVPIDSHLINTATDEEEDGRYAYFAFWRPTGLPGQALACPDTPADLQLHLNLCKTVVIG